LTHFSEYSKLSLPARRLAADILTLPMVLHSNLSVPCDGDICVWTTGGLTLDKRAACNLHHDVHAWSFS